MPPPILRLRKLCYLERAVDYCSSFGFQTYDPPTSETDITDKLLGNKSIKGRTSNASNVGRKTKQRRCLDSCCWAIGCVCTSWWILMVLYHCLPVNTLPGFRVPETPGARLASEGARALHPVVLVPGIVTGGLEIWEGKPCAEGLFRKRLWGGSFTEIIKRPLCWLEHLSLHNETGLDPPGIRVRPVHGLVAADYFTPGYFVWAVLIENLAKLGYEEKNLYMSAYDWRLSFQNTEIRDQTLSRLKSAIELMFNANDCKKVVVVPHSMGVNYFLHFLKWVETPAPMGGGGGSDWCAMHIKAIMNIAPPFLGIPKSVSNILSSEAKDVAVLRAMAPGVLNSETSWFQTLEHFMRVARTWDSIISLVPKGGETIWGNLDWSAEEGFLCPMMKTRDGPKSSLISKNSNDTDGERSFGVTREPTKFGRIISFGQATSTSPSSKLPSIDPKDLSDGTLAASNLCREVWTEYDELNREKIRNVADKKAYTAQTLFNLLRLVAPKMMKRAEAHFSHGIANDLDDPKYDHYKYWSNPLETRLPNARDMEIYCLYGVGIPTERSYVYKMSLTDKCNSIPFRIDGTANGDVETCLRGGIYFVDGDESVPVVSAGFMCARGWKGRTRFNPSGTTAYVREYKHKPPASLLEGRGLGSGAHVDIMGNVALIEDVLRVATGATGAEIGGDVIYSDIMKISKRINIRL